MLLYLCHCVTPVLRNKGENIKKEADLLKHESGLADEQSLVSRLILVFIRVPPVPASPYR